MVVARRDETRKEKERPQVSTRSIRTPGENSKKKLEGDRTKEKLTAKFRSWVRFDFEPNESEHFELSELSAKNENHV
jgi:hypothetical protein